jgi:phosphoribosyl-AMP cyclohydrolase
MKIKEEDIKFAQRSSVQEIEEGTSFTPKFNADGLLPCITVEYETNQILMFSYLTEEALKKSISLKLAHYYSRSRNNIWLKGEVSGMKHFIEDIFIDDDQDSIIYVVRLNEPSKGGKKASCHVGYKSCFYRKIKVKEKSIELEFTEKEKSFNPDIIYDGIANPTKI